MAEYLNLVVPEPVGISRRARLMLAIASVLVLVAFVGVIEVGVLAAVTIVSSGRNRQ
jgi:hypothetical protein